MKLTALSAGIILTFATLFVFAEEKHMAEALKHTDAAIKAGNGKAVAEYAEAAISHAKSTEKHLDGGIKSLEGAIEQGKLGNHDLAKRNAVEAQSQLKVAQ